MGVYRAQCGHLLVITTLRDVPQGKRVREVRRAAFARAVKDDFDQIRAGSDAPDGLQFGGGVRRIAGTTGAGGGPA